MHSGVAAECSRSQRPISTFRETQKLQAALLLLCLVLKQGSKPRQASLGQGRFPLMQTSVLLMPGMAMVSACAMPTKTHEESRRA